MTPMAKDLPASDSLPNSVEPTESPGTSGGGAMPNQLVMLTAPSGSQAEAIRVLRTHVVAQHLNQGRRALAVCAASAGVGCTWVATNLAIALAQIGFNTLLIDGNLRRPGIANLLPGPEGSPGLSESLANDEQGLEALIQPGPIERLSVIQAGKATRNAQELLGGERFKALLEACLRDFDVTIVDTPPANAYADARRISSLIGYSLVVARRNVTLVEDVKTLVGELTVDHAHVIGTVLNEA
jgi:capsular exopolysaccharide synthesis family protein